MKILSYVHNGKRVDLSVETLKEEIEKVWTPEAREAALEARRAKAKEKGVNPERIADKLISRTARHSGGLDPKKIPLSVYGHLKNYFTEHPRHKEYSDLIHSELKRKGVEFKGF